MKVEEYNYGGGYGWQLDEFTGDQKKCATLIAAAIEKNGVLKKIECQTDWYMDCLFDWHSFEAAHEFAKWAKQCTDDDWEDYEKIVMTFELGGDNYEIHFIPSRSELAPWVYYRGSYDGATRFVHCILAYAMKHRLDGVEGMSNSNVKLQ